MLFVLGAKTTRGSHWPARAGVVTYTILIAASLLLLCTKIAVRPILAVGVVKMIYCEKKKKNDPLIALIVFRRVWLSIVLKMFCFTEKTTRFLARNALVVGLLCWVYIVFLSKYPRQYTAVGTVIANSRDVWPGGPNND